MDRLEQIIRRLPDATRVDIEAWGGEPTFRVGGKVFVFTNHDATTLTVKLTKEEAAAVTATDSDAVSSSFGLGRNGWVTISIGRRAGGTRWQEIEEWVTTSYSLVAPKRLARQILQRGS
jgi:predicted DNA-binding protein (MmcQ/YjbR family)